MPVTEAEWNARARTIRPQPERTLGVDPHLLAQAQVASSLLTGHPAWDVYLQRLQVMLDEATSDLSAWQAKIHGALLDSDLRMIQNQCNRCLAQIQTLHYCMALPKEILSSGTTLDKCIE